MESKNNQIEIIKQDVNNLISEIEKSTEKCKRIDKVEALIFKSLLEMGKHLLQLYIILIKEKVEEAFKKKATTEHYQNKGLFNRSYFSIFGLFYITRKKYYIPQDKQIVYPLDNALSLPDGKYSYLLQNWIGNNATDTDFRSSVELLNRILGQNFLEMQSERISNKLSTTVEEFYQEEEINVQEEGVYFAAGFDDKGIPIIPSDMNREAESTGVRLGKGQKNGVKKSSTVSVSYSFDPFIRSAEDVVASLFKETTVDNNTIEPSEPQKFTKNKHIRAFISDKEKAIDYGLENITKRDSEMGKEIVILIDGDRGLEKAIDRVMTSKGIKDRIASKVLDIIHVIEYLWKAANVHFGEKSPKRIDWVKEQCLLILQSKIETVVENLQELIKQNEGKPTIQKTIETVINYFLNHKHMMDYQSYLARGFPISTGAVESACGHFVKNRMERNGMRWSLKGAQNMLNLRAVNKNKDWDNYMEYYIDKEQGYIRKEYKMVA